MKGNELREEQIGIVRPTADSTAAKAKWAVARRAADEKWTYEEIVHILEALGLRPPEKPTPGHTNPVGKNVTPETQRKRRERNKASKRAARDRNRKAAS